MQSLSEIFSGIPETLATSHPDPRWPHPKPCNSTHEGRLLRQYRLIHFHEDQTEFGSFHGCQPQPVLHFCHGTSCRAGHDLQNRSFHNFSASFAASAANSCHFSSQGRRSLQLPVRKSRQKEQISHATVPPYSLFSCPGKMAKFGCMSMALPFAWSQSMPT